MISFYSLTLHEQTFTMFMAYFYDVCAKQLSLLEMASQVMLPNLATEAFQQLFDKQLVESEWSHYTKGDKRYRLHHTLLVPALYELFQTKNEPILRSIRGAYRKKFPRKPLSYSLRQVIHLIDPEQPEGRDVSANDSPFFYEISMLLDDTRYESLFEKMSGLELFQCLRTKLLYALCKDEEVNWTYMKQWVDLVQVPKVYHQWVNNLFAFFYFLGTGNIDIDLRTIIPDQFSLQLVAITELYKGNYEQAYKLYVKAMSANNKVSAQKGIFVNPVSNYFFAIVSIMVGSEASLKKISTMSKQIASSSSYSLLDAANFHLILPLQWHFYDKVDFNIDEDRYEHFFHQNLNKGFSCLSYMMYQRLGLLTSKIEVPKDAPVWAYLKHEVQSVTNAEEMATLAHLFGGTPLFARLPIQPVWQTRLENLIAVNEQSEEQSTDETRQTLLIYLLRYHNIVPVYKKRLKSGAWSVGKELSPRIFKKLNDPYLDETDQKLMTAITEWTFAIDQDDYLHLLEGCNRVYTQTQQGLQPVSIHQEKPCLIINKQKNGVFNVSSNIETQICHGDSSPLYHKNTETDYSIFRPSPFEVNAYKEILAQKKYPAEAEPLLVKLIATLGGKTEIHSNMVAELDNLERAEVPPIITIRLSPTTSDTFSLTAAVCPTDSLAFVPGRGNVTTIAEKEGRRVQWVRSLKSEKKNLHQICEGLIEIDFFEEGEEWQPDSTADALTLSISHLLPFMQWCRSHEDLCVMEWPEGKKLTYHPALSSRSAHLSFKQRGGWFEVEGEVEISDGQVLSFQKLLELMRQSGKQKFIRINDNEYLTLSTQLARILKRIDSVSTEHRSHLQMAPAAVALLGDVLDDATLRIEHNLEIESLRSRIEESSKTTPSVPKMLQARLRDYQEEGFEWMSRVTSWGAGICLADDMGLGKTLQTITLLLEQSSKGPSLVVAPASVVPNWRNELQRFAPTLQVILLNQSDNRAQSITDAAAGDIVLTTYALLNIQQEELTARCWNIVCLDEAHTIKNAGTKMSKAAMQLQAQRKVILTGTPIQNHLAELWNLFHFINPGLLGSAEQFKKKFIQPIEADHDKERQYQLRRLIAPFLLRRTKSEVIEELPAKNEIQLPIELSPEEMTMYEVRRREAESAVLADPSLKVDTLAHITRLRRMACSCALVDEMWQHPSSKILAFIDLAESLNDSGNRALVFSQFTSFFDEVRRAMDKARLPYLYLDGTTPMAKREQLVRDFQSGNCPFFLISLKAGGLGLNLTGANYVIHLDPWWNPAIEQQATDRAYRIGQQQDVTVYHLIAQHTVEEKILRLHKTKRDLADSLLEGADISHAITQEEMLELLKND